MFDGTFWYFLRLMISLPIVLALAYFGTKFVLNQKLFKIGHRNSAISIIERVQVAPKAFLCIAEIDNTFYLLAVNENSTQLLKELKDFEPPELQVSGANNSFAELDFQKILEQSLSKLKDRLKKGDKSNE